jgi:hypothetical protein
MALAAIVAGDRAPTGNGRTYGLYRLEILAALANAVLLFAVAGYVILEAVRRLQEPSEVLVIPMLVVAVAGLAINLIGWRLLRPGAIESLTMSPETLGRRAAWGVCHRRPGRPVPILRPGFEDGVSQWGIRLLYGRGRTSGGLLRWQPDLEGDQFGGTCAYGRGDRH